MTAKTTTKKEGANGEALNSEIPYSELDKAFDDFEKNDAEFTPDPKPQEKENDIKIKFGEPEKIIDPNQHFIDDMKAKFFVGMFTYLLAGANTFLLNMIMGYEVPVEQMEMNEAEKISVSHYMKSPEIMAWLNKLPPWLIGIMHVEYIFIRKFNAVKKDFKKEKKEKAIKEKTTKD